MIISLIGMSGSGKTYWSKKLSEKGFTHLCCDDLIEERLSDELKKLGYSGIADVSRWMGQPYEPKYKQTSGRYLEFENRVMEEVFSWLESDHRQNVVVDTTGSLIYINPKTLKLIKKLTKVIYFKVPQEVKDEMFKLYIKDPKPVIWGDSFKKLNGESSMEALRKCYPKLLEFRSAGYAKLADKILDYQLLRDGDFNLSKFLELIKQ